MCVQVRNDPQSNQLVYRGDRVGPVDRKIHTNARHIKFNKSLITIGDERPLWDTDGDRCVH